MHVVFFVLKTVEVPQLQFLDKVVYVFFVQFIGGVDVSVIMQRHGLLSVLGKVVDMPVGVQVTGVWFRQCKTAETLFTVQTVQDRRFHGAVLDVRRHARWCANDRIWSDSAEKLWFRSCILLTRWSMSLLLQFIDEVWTSLRICSDARREKGRILRHFWFFYGFFGALDGTQFLLYVVEGRWVALTPGPSGRANW